MPREELSSWLLPTTLLLVIVLVGWAVLTASQTIARSFNLALYLIANLVVFVDAIDFVLRLYFRRIQVVASEFSLSGTSVTLDLGRYTEYQKRLHLRPYAFIVSVHNAEDHIDAFLEAMEPYREGLWIIDDGSTDNTCARIRQAGWRLLEGERNRKKPGAIRRLLETLPPEIETVVVLDPDISLRTSSPDGLADLETVIFEFQRSGMAAFCPRIAIRRDGFLARFQAMEYCMAFSLGRMSLADSGISSGISVYRRNALETALKRHSLSVYAEDLENAAILLGAGERIYYDGRLVVETEGKRAWRNWFSQRIGWAFGLAKVYTEHFTEIWRASRRQLSTTYQFLVYMGGFNLVLHPIRILGLIVLSLSFVKGIDILLGLGVIPDWRMAEPVYFLSAHVKFTLLAFAALFAAVPRGERLHLLPVVPLYFFYILALIVPASVGYADWLSLRIWGRRIWGDHYESEVATFWHPRPRRLAKAMGTE